MYKLFIVKGAFACFLALTLAAPARAQEPASAGWFDLPLAGGTRTLAAMGLDPSERAETLTSLARMLHGQESRPLLTIDRLAALFRESGLGPGEEEGVRPVGIPAPLTRDAWQRLLDMKPGEDLSARLLTDRAATLVAAGLVETDATIRALALRDRDFLRRIYREAPGAFAIVARSLRLERGRVAVPGGAGAERIWEALAGVSPGRPEAFLVALLKHDLGRLAWYFDTLSTLNAARVAAAWPAGADTERLANAQALYESFRAIDARVSMEEHPYRRSAADPWMVLALTDIDGAALASPAWQWMWTALFRDSALDRHDAARLNRTDTAAISLTSLTRAICEEPLRERRDRFEMFRLAQRAFPDAREADATDIAVAISGYRRHKGVLLALERMRIRTPATWAALIEAARQVDRADGDAVEALMAFQAGFALVGRMWQVRTVDTPGAERLLLALSAAVQADRQVPRAVSAWVTSHFDAPYESSLLRALAGPVPATPRSIEWEGLTYHLDFAAAEGERLKNVRALLSLPGVDAALASGGQPAIAKALGALAYAVALGDPDGPAGLGGDIVERHDFGVRSTKLMQDMWPWSPPLEMQGLGQPWHLQGSLLGLDLALARLALRRIADDEMPRAPRLTGSDLSTLARTVVALVPADLTDGDRDEVIAAIARGRRRVAEAGRDPDRVRALAREVRLSAGTREMLPWIVRHAPDSIASLFGTRDLLWLGNPGLPADRLDRWGVVAQGLDNRQTLAMPPPAAWEDFGGRAELGQMATQIPDLTLRIAEETARLGLPASLVPALLAYAVADYWHDVGARFSDDWPAMVRQAAILDARRVEDYVAALAGTGPLR